VEPARATTVPASTTDKRPPAAAPLAAWLALLLGTGALAGCGPLSGRFSRTVPDGSPLERSGREDPALSGNGRILASVVEQGGRSTLMLQDQSSGRRLRLRHLRRHQPHSSPSLSWTGRYVAALVQQGSRRVAVIEDRLSGRLHRLPLPGDREPERLSLSPDARRVALEVVQAGRRRVQVFDLGGLLEPDLRGGTAAVGADGP
jgi:hypothetical protein